MINKIGLIVSRGNFKNETNNKILRLIAKLKEPLSKTSKFFKLLYLLKIFIGTNNEDVKIIKKDNIWIISIIFFVNNNSPENYELYHNHWDQFFFEDYLDL